MTDPTGAVVAGAAVTLTDISTNIARTTTTNASGRYIYVDVNPGIYSIAVSKAGFATTKSENQEVKVGASLTLNLALQVGGSNVVVEVTTVGTELQTMNATVGNTITSLTFDNLPSLGRDVSSFVELQPGVGPDGAWRERCSIRATSRWMAATTAATWTAARTSTSTAWPATRPGVWPRKTTWEQGWAGPRACCPRRRTASRSSR